jgi:hypothetical protein
MQPDWVWTKARSSAESHRLYDSVRGATKSLFTNNTNAESTEAQSLTAFNSNGFTLGTGAPNSSGVTYVGWQWRASNATAVTNTAGSVTSTVSANTSAGFSVVTYTGNGVDGATVGHGLGVTPSIVISKSRSATGQWLFSTNGISSSDLFLESTAAQDGFNRVTAYSSTTITLNNSSAHNANGTTYVSYFFSQVAGYSSFGSYTGNFNADGPFIYTGFKPKFVMLKASGDTGSWNIVDGTRNPSNVVNARLFPNNSNAENTATVVDFLSNGFKIRSSDSDFNYTVTNIYMAFAETPFNYSNAR